MKIKNSFINQNTFATNSALRRFTKLSVGLHKTDKVHEVKEIRINDKSDLNYLFNFSDKLGNGSFGVVLRVQEKSTNQIWAMKILNRKKIGSDRFRSLEREITILKIINHPHCIYLDRIYESPIKTYLLLELCREELTDTYKRKKRFSEDETRYVISQLASALSYLHKHYIIHRDIKLENILIAPNPISPNDELYIKVADFGLSVILNGIGIDDMLHDCCGTLTYMAPEMLAKNYNQQCDVWSMGVLMYLLLKGEFPFYTRDEQQMIKMIRTEEPSFDGIQLSSKGLQILSKMLLKNPTLRSTSAEIENHPWINTKTESQLESQNVIDMMHQWKNDLMTPIGDECDWIAFSKAPQQSASDADGNNGIRKPNSFDKIAQLPSVVSPPLDRNKSILIQHESVKMKSPKGKPAIFVTDFNQVRRVSDKSKKSIKIETAIPEYMDIMPEERSHSVIVEVRPGLKKPLGKMGRKNSKLLKLDPTIQK